MLRHTFLTLILAICLPLSGAEWRQYTSRDGLITREVHQIAELPNGQLLVNCEGVFCLFNGRRFEILPCDCRRVMPLPHFAEGYAHLWQGDSLLWLRDFHKLYLFDTRSRTFRYDWEQRIAAKEIQQLVSGATGAETLPSDVDSVMKVCGFPHPLMATTGLTDRQGGTWVCTREHGIFYMPPRRVRANTVPYVDEEEAFGVHDSQGRQWHTDTEGLICHTAEGIIRYRQAGSAPLPGARNVKEVKGLYHNDLNFITPLPDGRLLLCNMMNVLGYFSPEACTFTCLNERLPAISHHRFLVGACPMAEENRVLVYAQDGVFILDTRADTLCDFPARETIERYADKYNCALQARDKRLWVGTQNGLFVVEDGKAGGATRISGLANDCIRSLVEDEEGDIWVGTSCGISRVGRGVMNLDESDGIPNAPMTERGERRRPGDGHLLRPAPGPLHLRGTGTGGQR